MRTADSLEAIADCERSTLDTRALLQYAINLFEPFSQPGHTPRVRALALSWLTGLVLSQHPQAYHHIGHRLMPNLGDQLKRYGGRRWQRARRRLAPFSLPHLCSLLPPPLSLAPRQPWSLKPGAGHPAPCDAAGAVQADHR